MLCGNEEGTGDWCSMPLPQAVTSLAVFNSMLIGTTEHGGLVVDNKKGGFHQHRFEGMFLNRFARSSRRSICVCEYGAVSTDRNESPIIMLHEMNYAKNQGGDKLLIPDLARSDGYIRHVAQVLNINMLIRQDFKRSCKRKKLPAFNSQELLLLVLLSSGNSARSFNKVNDLIKTMISAYWLNTPGFYRIKQAKRAYWTQKCPECNILQLISTRNGLIKRDSLSEE